MFFVDYSKQAEKFLERAEKIVAKRILSKIDELTNEPALRGSKPVHGYKEKLYRVRVGDYRILYEVDYQAKKIGIVEIDDRGRIYD
ncbi:MAG TPA: type II toxin-antitoxin system RelE/ParE family toxin [archaeon]|nr:type II toxin-antitoxin system RelE/ParE family toxin [Candidatus Woesearchaeota archaeon]HLD39227.1 type II toxin-antitoxin system RelE/ParE family toxin [archaeon]